MNKDKINIINAFFINNSKHTKLYFTLKVVILVTIILTGAILTLSSTIFLSIVGIFMLGCMFAHAIELQHEVLHMYANRSNCLRVLGFLLGVPMLICFSHYQYNHMRHHRFVGTEIDNEFFNYGDRKSTVFAFLRSLLMITHYQNVFKNIFTSMIGLPLDIKDKRVERRIKKEYFFLGIILFSFLIISLIAQSTILLKIWLFPFVFVAIPVHVLIEIPEHFGCNNATDNIFENTRTITAGRLMSWFVNGNNFHVEHHYAPAVPINELRRLHRFIGPNIRFKNISYFEFYINFFKKISILKKIKKSIQIEV